MGWKKKSAIIAAAVILFYTLAGFVIIPLAAEAVLPDKLAEALDRPVRIENISFNPYTLTLSVEGLEVEQKSGDRSFAAFERLFVNLQWVSLFKLSPVVSEISLKEPSAMASRISKNEFSFSDLLETGGRDKEQQGEKEEKGVFRFALYNISVTGGNFVFRDEPAGKTHRITDFSFELPMISNFEDKINAFSRPSISCTLNSTRLNLDVSTKPFSKSVETSLKAGLSGIDLSYYFDYVPVSPGFSVQSGILDIESSIGFKKTGNGENSLQISCTADLSDLKLAGADSSELLSLPSMHMEMAPSRPLKGRIRLASLSIKEPVVSVVRSEKGGLNLAELGPKTEKPAQEGPAEETADAESGGAEKPEKTGKGGPAAEPFVFELGKLKLSSGTVNFKDFAAPGISGRKEGGPVQMKIGSINLEVSDFSTSTGSRAELDFSSALPSGGSLSAQGTFVPDPFSADLDLEIKNLGLGLAQPYFPDSLNLVISKGIFGISGRAGVRSGKDKGFGAEFKGKAGIRDFSAVEQGTARDLLEWDSLDLQGIDVSWNPAKISLDRIGISGLKQTAVIREDGSLNLSSIYKAEKEAAEKEKKKGKEKKTGEVKEEKTPGLPVSIGEIILRDAGFKFTDYNIQPNFSTEFTIESASIKGLSTEVFEGAKMSVKGAVDEHAPVKVSGRVNPLLENLLLDISFDLKNLELAPLSVYSGRYIGRAIEKGKLNLELDYLVENKKLDAENRILLDQLSLGRRVESEDAVNLPVGLAVALLKNRKGEINLDLPVSGRLDNPKFSAAGIIIQSLKNMIAKAATSPFALVSSIVSGGEELRYIQFRPGNAELAESARKKLDSIQKLLYKRPELNIELTGYSDPAEDRKALAAKALERKILAAKWEKKSGEKKKAVELSDIELTEKERLKYLRQVYKETVLSGKDASSDAKPLSDETLTPEEMKKEIRKRIRIKDAELRLLVQKRIKRVKGFILEDKRLEAERLFIKEADTLKPPDPGKFKLSRVEIGLI